MNAAAPRPAAVTQPRTDRRDASGRIVGQETNGGELVTLLSDSRLKTLRAQVWDRSDSHDLAVIDNELGRRELAGAAA